MQTMNIGLSASLLCAGILACTFGSALPVQAAPKRVLVVTTTTGFRHSSIPTAERVLGELAKQTGAFTVEYARVEPSDPQFKGPDGKPDKREGGGGHRRGAGGEDEPGGAEEV